MMMMTGEGGGEKMVLVTFLEEKKFGNQKNKQTERTEKPKKIWKTKKKKRKQKRKQLQKVDMKFCERDRERVRE